MSCSGETYDREEELIRIRPAVMRQLKKAKYGVVDHSTVELCHWTKKSFGGGGEGGDCYKHKFYGISTHRCMEFSPAGMHCENRCVYCWRPMEFYDSVRMDPAEVAGPEQIMEGLMEERRKLIMGHYGDPAKDRERLDESLRPAHYAISLSGEPTMYPRLPELIRYLRGLEDTKSIFLVTNGQEPDMIERLRDEDALPTQLYLSTNAADYDSFVRINRPRYEDSWQRWNRTLGMLDGLGTRTVVRITLIRGYNTGMREVPAFAGMLKGSGANFVEVKSYMHVGRSTNRLERDNMLHIGEVREFAHELARQSGVFSVMDESESSRIVVLQNMERFVDRRIPTYLETTPKTL